MGSRVVVVEDLRTSSRSGRRFENSRVGHTGFYELPDAVADWADGPMALADRDVVCSAVFVCSCGTEHQVEIFQVAALVCKALMTRSRSWIGSFGALTPYLVSDLDGAMRVRVLQQVL